jgi:threonine dehydratase
LAAVAGTPGIRGVVAHSSGNHARAVAFAAKRADIPAVLVMPRTVSEVKAAGCRELGAEIVLVEPTLAARVTTADRLAAERGYELVPPFDDRRVIAGQGTIGLEIMADAPETDLILVPVSGGGLVSGIAVAAKAVSPGVRVVGVEPELAADARASLRAGRRVAWPAADVGRTIADGLRVEVVGELPFAHMTALVDDIVTVSEDEIRAAMAALATGSRVVAEPSGAVAPAAALFRRAELPAAKAPVAVVSGGNVEAKFLGDTLSTP